MPPQPWMPNESELNQALSRVGHKLRAFSENGESFDLIRASPSGRQSAPLTIVEVKEVYAGWSGPAAHLEVLSHHNIVHDLYADTLPGSNQWKISQPEQLFETCDEPATYMLDDKLSAILDV